MMSLMHLDIWGIMGLWLGCDPSRALAVSFVHNYDVTMLGDDRQFILE